MNNLTAEEAIALVLMWGRLAPKEDNNWVWSCRWQRWEAEHGFLPDGFLKPDSEDEAVEEYATYRQEQNDRYDRRHAR